MRLAAIFFDKSTTINFGSNYNYEISQDDDGAHLISRTLNGLYISNFYAPDTILNISAIVGKNGVGKTLQLREIANEMFVLPQGFVRGVVIFEEDGNDKTIIPKIKIKNTDKENYEKRDFEDLVFKTIYYSPFLDFKSYFPSIDLSLDNLLSIDLDASSEEPENSSLMRRLKQKNTKRFIKFKISKYAEYVSKLFDFPKGDLFRVTFTRYKIVVGEEEVRFYNTPEDFQYFLKKLFLKIRQESTNLNRSVNNETEIFELQKNHYKNDLLMDIFCLLIHLMEKKNTLRYVNLAARFKNVVERKAQSK
jgi:hypothetical protein